MLQLRNTFPQINCYLNPAENFTLNINYGNLLLQITTSCQVESVFLIGRKDVLQMLETRTPFLIDKRVSFHLTAVRKSSFLEKLLLDKANKWNDIGDCYKR